MGEVPGKIGAIACLEDVAAIGCPHLHHAGENEEHLFPVMLLPVADRFGADVEQERLHEAALRREQLKAVGIGVLQRSGSGRRRD